MIDQDKIKAIVEAALFAADEPLSVDRLVKLFQAEELDPEDGRNHVRAALEALEAENDARGVELKRVASGYRMQVKQDLSLWVSRLWDEKPPRYSRALLETLALIAYRQPVTRGDIEEVRGVAVSTNIIRTLSERGWIREVGHREVPGRPALYGTTRAFLDYFNLKSLNEMPPLAEIRQLVEPVVVEEVVSEVAGEMRDEARPTAESTPADEAFDVIAEPDGDGEPAVVDDSQDPADASQTPTRHTAEVVPLPTTPRH